MQCRLLSGTPPAGEAPARPPVRSHTGESQLFPLLLRPGQGSRGNAVRTSLVGAPRTCKHVSAPRMRTKWKATGRSAFAHSLRWRCCCDGRDRSIRSCLSPHQAPGEQQGQEVRTARELCWGPHLWVHSRTLLTGELGSTVLVVWVSRWHVVRTDALVLPATACGPAGEGRHSASPAARGGPSEGSCRGQHGGTVTRPCARNAHC